MGRLQAARHGRAIHATGVAKIAFAIDREGHLVSARIAHGSGSAAVDAAALGLVRRAAPFPTPPTGAGDKELTFVVPVSFKHGD